MSEFLIQDTTLEDIADAIRAKKGTSAGIQVSNFPSEIASIPTGSNGAIVNPFISSSDSIMLTDNYFEYNGDMYCIGINMTSSQYIFTLHKWVNGEWSAVGKLCNINDWWGYQNSVELQYAVIRHVSYNPPDFEPVVDYEGLIFSFEDFYDNEFYMYYYDLTNISWNQNAISVSLPSDQRHLFFTTATNDTLFLYLPSTDSLWSAPITSGGVGTWTEIISGNVFGSIPNDNRYLMSKCRTRYNYTYLIRSDVNKIVRAGVVINGISDLKVYTGSSGDMTGVILLYPYNNDSLRAIRTDVATVYNSPVLVADAYPINKNDSAATFTFGNPVPINFRPSNGNLFFKTYTNDQISCMNGYGCVGYLDGTQFTNKITLL